MTPLIFDWPESVLPPTSVVTAVAGIAFTEGPACAADGTVYFSDIANNRIVKLSPGNPFFSVFRQPSGRANGLLFDREGRLLACEGNEHSPNDGNRRVTRTDLKTGKIEVLADRFEGQRFNSPNDIAVRTNGQIFFTDPCYGDRNTMELDHDSVYRIDIHGAVTRLITQPLIQRPNGIALSPDQKTLYLVDSCPVAGGNRKIWAFDLADDGSVSGQRVVVDFAPGRGGDGMCVDSQGRLFIAAGIARPRHQHETTAIPTGVHIFTPDGQSLGGIPIPEDVISNCTFGGTDMRTLYITAGKHLFQVRVDTPGWAVHRNEAGFEI
jgi:gluconolactonase